MTSRKSLFYFLDEEKQRIVCFSNDQIIKHEGRGSIFMNCSNGDTMRLKNVPYV